MMSPVVSVIITSYNRPEFIRDAVRSVINQTFKDYEIIIVDDASNEQTQQSIELICNEFDSIKYVHHTENKGLAAARNTGLSSAEGEFAAFLDDDDIWLPTKLEKQVKKISDCTEDVAVVYCGLKFFKNSPDHIVGVRIPEIRGNIRKRLLRNNFVSPVSVLLRVDCLKRSGRFDENYTGACQDWDLWVRISEFFTFEYIDECLILVRLYDNEISQSKNAQKYLHGRLSFFNKHKNLIEKDKTINAQHLREIGNTYHSVGNRKMAIKFLFESMRNVPYSPKTLLCVVRSLLL